MVRRAYNIESFIDNYGRLGSAEEIGSNVSMLPGYPYPGVDLTKKFAAEIAAAPYNGNECAWIKAREQDGNYAGINVADYIPLTTTNGYTFTCRIMGIDTYTGYGDEDHIVGHHIDWNWDELWPEAVKMNLVRYNQGLIPVEDVTADGTATTFVLEKEMDDVAKIEAGGVELSGWTYDATTYTITFETAPAAGTLTVTGTGSESPWKSCDAHLFVNSLAGQVPNGTTLNPPVIHVDYTKDGIYHYLPQKWKDIIIPKREYVETKFSATELLNSPNSMDWVDLGNIWPLRELEVFGLDIIANNNNQKKGFAKYPLFDSYRFITKYLNGERQRWCMLETTPTSQTSFVYVSTGGYSSSVYANSTCYFNVCFRT